MVALPEVPINPFRILLAAAARGGLWMQPAAFARSGY